MKLNFIDATSSQLPKSFVSVSLDFEDVEKFIFNILYRILFPSSLLSIRDARRRAKQGIIITNSERSSRRRERERDVGVLEALPVKGKSFSRSPEKNKIKWDLLMDSFFMECNFLRLREDFSFYF